MTSSYRLNIGRSNKQLEITRIIKTSENSNSFAHGIKHRCLRNTSHSYNSKNISKMHSMVKSLVLQNILDRGKKCILSLPIWILNLRYYGILFEPSRLHEYILHKRNKKQVYLNILSTWFCAEYQNKAHLKSKYSFVFKIKIYLKNYLVTFISVQVFWLQTGMQTLEHC